MTSLVMFERNLTSSSPLVALHYCNLRGNAKIAKYLLNVCNCNLFHPTNGGFTAFDLALVTSGNCPTCFGHPSIRNKQMDLVQSKLGSVDPYNTCTNIDFSEAFTPLHWSCCFGNLETVKL